MSILDWLGLGQARREDEGDGDVIHRIVRDLESMEPAAARYLGRRSGPSRASCS
jgi:hypothetical protein